VRGEQVTAVTCGKPTSCWISSTATERGDLRAACIAGWHPILPMSGRQGNRVHHPVLG
jgi:hypothetical protein